PGSEQLPAVVSAKTVDDLVAGLLQGDRRVADLQLRMEHHAMVFDAATEAAFGTASAGEDLVALVELAVRARHPGDEESLIPARYHFFLRALEGGYLCLHPS